MGMLTDFKQSTDFKMKKIYFDKLSSWRNAVLVLLTAICAVSGALMVFWEDYPAWLKWVTVFIGLCIAFYTLFTGFRNYYVGWNKVGMTIRIKSLFGKSFSFEEITSFGIQEEVLVVIRKDNQRLEFDLHNVEENDIEKLMEVLTENISSKPIFA